MHRHGLVHEELDQFHVEPREDLSPQTVRVRPGNVVVMVRDYNTLYHLASVLNRVNPAKQDVVVLHIRILMRAGSGEHGLVPEQLFTTNEQELFTKALSLAEKSGKTVRLAVAAANEIWDGILRSAQSLQASTIVLGLSPKVPVTEEARLAGLAWERLSEPKPQLTLEIYTPTGSEHVFYMGPHAPHLTAKEIDLLHNIWLQLSNELPSQEVHHHDIIHFALAELRRELADGKQAEVLTRLKQHLEEIKDRRAPHL
jgi:hypothetical protein